MEKEHWIQGAIKKPGALRKALKVKKGEKISEEKLHKAEHSKNPTMRKRAHLAETLKKMHHHEGSHDGPHHSKAHHSKAEHHSKGHITETRSHIAKSLKTSKGSHHMKEKHHYK